MNGLYEAKRKIIEAGQSRIFADWVKHSTITKEEFLDGVKWLCEDPKENGRATRQLCLKPDGLVKAKRVYDDLGMCAIYVDGKLWEGALFPQKLSEKESALYGTDEMFVTEKIGISIDDRI